MHYFTYKSSSSSFLKHWIILILFNLNNISESKKSHHSLPSEKSKSDSDELIQDYVGMDYNEEKSSHGKKFELEI